MRIVKSAITVFLMAFLVASIFSACKKKKNTDPVPAENRETEEITVDSTIFQFKIKASKVNTMPLNPALGAESKMCFGNNKIYTFSRNTEKFMSYDIAANTWKNLTYTNQLAYAGYTGKMMYMPSHSIFYLHGARDIYYTSEYPDLAKREKWNSTVYVPDEYSSGESGYALYYNDIYSIGGRKDGVDNSTDIRKYNSSTDEWTKPANLSGGLRRANALVHDNKVYVIGSLNSSGINYCQGYIFDIMALTTKSFPLPKDFDRVVADSYQFTAYKDYLFLNNGSREFFVYNTKTKKWNNWHVMIEGDFLSGNVNLFVAENGKFYAAGGMDGNFALFELQVTFPEKELE